MNKDINKSTFKQVFSILSQFKQRLEEMEADRYVKKMTTLQFIELMMTAQLNKESSLRDISSSLSNEALKQEINLDSISASQISRRLRNLCTELLQRMFKSLVTYFGCKNGLNSIKKNLGNIYLIDSTTITLCLTKYRWAKFRSTRAGVKAHLRLKFGMDDNIPDKVVITPARL